MQDTKTKTAAKTSKATKAAAMARVARAIQKAGGPDEGVVSRMVDRDKDFCTDQAFKRGLATAKYMAYKLSFFSDAEGAAHEAAWKSWCAIEDEWDPERSSLWTFAEMVARRAMINSAVKAWREDGRRADLFKLFADQDLEGDLLEHLEHRGPLTDEIVEALELRELVAEIDKWVARRCPTEQAKAWAIARRYRTDWKWEPVYEALGIVHEPLKQNTLRSNFGHAKKVVLAEFGPRLKEWR